MNANGKPPHTIVQVRGLCKQFTEGETAHQSTRRILDSVDLDIAQGEFLVLLGKSGSGKSTLLNLISGIDTADSGSILIDGEDITRLNDRALTLFRRKRVGIIFQFFNLIPTLTVLENILLPVELSGSRTGEDKARDLLARVGLADRADSFPDKLSGGEQQRVAIARALINEPAVVIADEPTGNLDEETGQRILSLLLELTCRSGRTLIMATHNADVVAIADRVCRIHEGKLVITRSRIGEGAYR
ncbi:MAG: ABC transporter ATP-binding protein [Anaerolineae bacterium]|nr:ABC transporter ATP-binding protein [Anaerolineae bacterium]NUQ03162.1 ABC transporter ATP-binding protein [Anaerolineae bacterium]